VRVKCVPLAQNGRLIVRYPTAALIHMLQVILLPSHFMADNLLIHVVLSFHFQRRQRLDDSMTQASASIVL
jgi:hypothetical protein